MTPEALDAKVEECDDVSRDDDLGHEGEHRRVAPLHHVEEVVRVDAGDRTAREGVDQIDDRNDEDLEGLLECVGPARPNGDPDEHGHDGGDVVLEEARECMPALRCVVGRDQDVEEDPRHRDHEDARVTQGVEPATGALRIKEEHRQRDTDDQVGPVGKEAERVEHATDRAGPPWVAVANDVRIWLGGCGYEVEDVDKQLAAVADPRSDRVDAKEDAGQ